MKRATAVNPDQLDLWFEIPQEPTATGGSLDYATELRHVLSDAITASGKNRYEIAAEMSRLTGIEVTKAQLDAWTAESRTVWRFPFEYAAAFEVATGSYSLVDLLTRKRGCKAYWGREAVMLELGRLEKDEQELKRRKSKLKQLLGDEA